ncbi:MAG: S-layer homology domain-containing protein [Syntrophomonadaceae bacterium]
MKRTISLLLTLTLLLTLVVGSAAAKPFKSTGQGQNKVFWDIQGHWGQAAIVKGQDRGFFNGYADGSFRPDNPITSDELAVIIDRLLVDCDDDDQDENDEDVNISGVPAWARNSVWKGNLHGYINLKRYHSAVQMSRLEACVELADALIDAGLIDPVEEDEYSNPFGDCSSISDEDCAKIMALYKAGIIKGTAKNLFNPNSHLTRAMIAMIIGNVSDLEQYKDLTLNDNTLTINADDEETVTGTLADKNLDIEDVKWAVTAGEESIIDDVKLTWEDNKFDATIMTSTDAAKGDKCTITFTVKDQDDKVYKVKCQVTIGEGSASEDEIWLDEDQIDMDENRTKTVRVYLPDGFDTADVESVDWDSDDTDVADLNYDEGGLLDHNKYFLVEVESDDVDGDDSCTITIKVKLDGDWYDTDLEVNVADLD